MSKRNRLRKETMRTAPVETAPAVGFKLGGHDLPAFGAISAAFGADLADYPKYEDIPEQFRRGNTPFNKAVSGLFFKGGRLEDYGLRLKAGTDRGAFFLALRALIGSFAPKHELKDATCAWLLSEYAEQVKDPA